MTTHCIAPHARNLGPQLVIWDLRMASSSVRNFGAASKAVLRQVDVARRVQLYYSGGDAAGDDDACAHAGAAAAGGGVAAGGRAAGLGGGGGCFFSQLLPCPWDARLLAFVQTDLQVGAWACMCVCACACVCV
jgi:hypothetical protein